MTFTPYIPIPIYLVYCVVTQGKKAFYPAEDWAPQKVTQPTHEATGGLPL